MKKISEYYSMSNRKWSKIEFDSDPVVYFHGFIQKSQSINIQKKYERQFIFVLNSRLRKETIKSVDDSEKQK